jgi:hypothetical protein
MPTSQHGASNRNFTKMDSERSHDIKTLICDKKHASSTPHPTSTAPIRRNRKFVRGRISSLSGIAGLPKTFPLANWCCLTNQTDFTLNMLWSCCQNPALLVFEALKGSYSFDATPIAPLGTEVPAHHKPNQRSSWGFHELNMWYISPSLQHY